MGHMELPDSKTLLIGVLQHMLVIVLINVNTGGGSS